MATTFMDDDAGYVKWRDTHAGGYVLNTARVPAPNYLKLHRTACPHLNSRDPRQVHLTRSYIKVCSTSVDDLRDWARRRVAPNAELDYCPACKP